MDAVSDVQERCTLQGIVFHNPDASGLLDHKQPPAFIPGVGDVNGLVETINIFGQFDVWPDYVSFGC